MSVLDAGCGSGRNLRFFLRAGYEVYGADRDPAAIAAVRQLAAGVGATARAENFRVEQLENMSFPDGIAEFVVSSAVLHFAQDDNQFDAMLRGTWRVLMPGGVFFLPPRVVDWHAGPNQKSFRTPVSASGWNGTIPGGRGAPDEIHSGTWWGTAGPTQDHGRSESALHDDVGSAKTRLNWR